MTVAIKGIGVVSSIKTALGPVASLVSETPSIEPRAIPTNQVEAEVERFMAAVRKAAEQLHHIRNQVPEHTPVDILEFIDTHLLMVEDKAISDATVHCIREEGCSAEWALHLRHNQLLHVFEEMEDPYLRTRKDDLNHVIQRIQKNLAEASGDGVPEIEGHILVASDLTPAEVILLHHQGALGLVTEHGSSMSHTAILARSLGIPAVVGAHGACAGLQSGAMVVVDAANDQVLAECDEETLAQYRAQCDAELRARESLKDLCGTPATTLDGVTLSLQANIEMPSDVAAVQAVCAQGIGLYRTEFLYMNRTEVPTEEEHFQAYAEVVQGMQGYPVTIRTLDLGADKHCDLLLEPSVSPNPALGLRAIRLCLKETDLFRVQIRAILRASALGDLRLMIPMLTNLWEARHARALIEDEMRSLESAGIAFNRHLPIGAMIEIPAAAITAREFAEYFDFLSIGTNDLIQYTLAVDRSDDMVNHLYDPLHPAVLRLIQQVIDAGKATGKPISMCGEMAGDPRYIPLLIGMGLEYFSMQAGGILEAKKLIHGLHRRRLSQRTKAIMGDLCRVDLDLAIRDIVSN